MNKAYQTMRGFWLDVKNLKHKEEVPQLGAHKICVAGVEMAAKDDQGAIKNIFIAASSLGNASLYFENKSPSGIGGMTGGAASGPIREKALHFLQTAVKLADTLPQAGQLPLLQDPAQVSLFVVSTDGTIRCAMVTEEEVRKPEHPWYAFFAYSQQLLGAFRMAQEQTVKAPQAPQPPTQVTEKQNETKV